MLKDENLYFSIPFEPRRILCTLLNLNLNNTRLQTLLLSDLPVSQSTTEENTKEKILYNAIGKKLIAEYEEYKQHKKLQLSNWLSTNNEQVKIKAKSLKFEKYFQIKEPTFCTGLGFFYALEALARKEVYRISIPESILIGFMHLDTTKIWTDKQGILRCSVVDWENLADEIVNILSKNVSDFFPAVLIKYESYNSEGIKQKSEVILYKYFEVKEILSKIHSLNPTNSYVVVQEFIRPKASSSSKIRVLFSDKIEKLYRVNNRKILKERKESINNRKKEKTLCIDEAGITYQNFEIFKYSAEICDFFLEVFYYCDVLNDEHFKFAEFFKKKKLKFVKKLDSIENHGFHRQITKMILNNGIRSKLVKKFTVNFSEQYSIAYPVNNFLSFEGVSALLKELVKGSKLILPNNLKITEIVIDVLEDIKGMNYLHKVQRVNFQEKSVGQMPTTKHFRHISLYSATEGSSVVKGKRQQVCCGDYCHLLKKHDIQTSEKIELLLKARPEHSTSLLQLLKIQNFLNLDSAQSLFNNRNRIGTPLTQNMQYKTVRRIILEDRNDPNSLKNAISSLPDEIIQEISISKIKPKEPEQVHLYHLNKKLSWEFELVPVCAICYKIYGLKDSQTPKNKSFVPSKIELDKAWKVKDIKFTLKNNLKPQKSFVDFGKVFEKIGQQVHFQKFIKNKIANSSFVTNKKGLENDDGIRPACPTVVQSLVNTTKISSGIINDVVKRFEKMQNEIKKSKSSNLPKISSSFSK